MTRKRNRAARRKRIEAAGQRIEAAAPKKEFISNTSGRLQAMYSTAGLFSARQFASITDTLVKASQRREVELRQRIKRQTAPAPAPTVQASYPEPSVTPVSAVGGSESSDSRGELEPVPAGSEVTVMDDHSAFNRTFSTSGESTRIVRTCEHAPLTVDRCLQPTGLAVRRLRH
jgi:hypothetical protein